MTAIVWLAALVVSAVHLLAFLWEVVLIERPSVHEGIFAVPAGDVPAIRLWAFGVGFYNLFLACGAIAGVAFWMAGEETAGKTLVAYVCVFAALSGLVLLVGDRLALSRERGSGVGGAIAQGVPPLVVLGAMLL